MSSSRRATSEINILAMLDGQAPGRRLLALPAAFWYGAAGVLACSLLFALAWLVRGATPTRDADTAGTAQASLPPGAAPAAAAAHDAGLATVHHDGGDSARDSIPVTVPGTRAALAAETPSSTSAPAPVPSSTTPPGKTAGSPGATVPATARGAVIIDLAPGAPATLPPPGSATAVSAAAVTGAPAHDAAGMAASRPRPVAAGTTTRTTTRTTTHATVPASPAASPLASPAAKPQPAYRTMPPQAPSLAHADPAPPRQKRAAAASRATPPSSSVDTDVALISAILQHTGTRNEAADAAGTSACVDKSCGPRMPPRQ